MMKAAGTAYPPPETATGTLNIIAASGAAPVTMQNNTWGNPNALFASPPDSLTGVTADGASVTGLMRPPAADDGPPREQPASTNTGGRRVPVKSTGPGPAGVGIDCRAVLDPTRQARGCRRLGIPGR